MVAFVPVGCGLAAIEDSEDDCAASVGPKPKQAVSKGTVVDYKASVLLYVTCFFRYALQL